MLPLPARISWFRIDILLLLAAIAIGFTFFMSSTLTDQKAGDVCHSVDGCTWIQVKDWREDADENHFRQVWLVKVNHKPGRRTIDVLNEVGQKAEANVSWFARTVLFTVAPRIELQTKENQ